MLLQPHPNETLIVLIQEARPSLACGRSLFTDPPFASTKSTTWTAICKLVNIADDLASFCVFFLCSLRCILYHLSVEHHESPSFHPSTWHYNPFVAAKQARNVMPGLCLDDAVLTGLWLQQIHYAGCFVFAKGRTSTMLGSTSPYTFISRGLAAPNLTSWARYCDFPARQKLRSKGPLVSQAPYSKP